MGKKKREKRALKVIAESRVFTVQQGVFRGSPDVIAVHVCRACGAVVWDPIYHDKWHQDQEKK